jgi:hypothetical protein
MTSAGDPYPGFAHAEAVLRAAADSGDKAILSAVESMAVLGEVARLREHVDATVRALRAVADGAGCWAAQQGYATCEHKGVAEVLAGVPPRRRWWRRSTSR